MKTTVQSINYRLLNVADRAEIEAMFEHDADGYGRSKRQLVNDHSVDSPMGELMAVHGFVRK